MPFEELYKQILDYSFYANPVRAWLVALGVSVIVFSALKIVKAVLIKNLEKLSVRTENTIDDLVVELLKDSHNSLFITFSLLIGSVVLDLPNKLHHLITVLPILVMLWQAGTWGNKIISFGLKRYVESQPNEEKQRLTETFLGPMRIVARFLLWSILILLALDNLGVDVTALVAGLGIGGVAVALAVQNVLGDLLAAISIIVDQPFVVGDFIIIDDLMGNVEKIGMKTTRVRSLSGEQLIFSNSDLLSSRIRNFKRMFERRIVFNYGVLYQTPIGKVEQISGWVKDIIESEEKARFDRSHFASFGDSSLDYEAVYHVTEPEYATYMDIQERINLAMMHKFAEEGVEFAYPTRTLFINQDPGVEFLTTLDKPEQPESKKSNKEPVPVK